MGDECTSEHAALRNSATAPADPNAAPAAQVCPALCATPRPSPWLPRVTFTQHHARLRRSRFVPKGYVIEDLPDVYVINRALGLQWQFEKRDCGFQIQPHAANQPPEDVRNQSTGTSAGSAQIDWRVTDTFGLTFAYDPTYNYRFDTNVRSDAYGRCAAA